MACKKLERWEYKTPCTIEATLLSIPNRNLCIMQSSKAVQWQGDAWAYASQQPTFGFPVVPACHELLFSRHAQTEELATPQGSAESHRWCSRGRRPDAHLQSATRTAGLAPAPAGMNNSQ